MPTESAPAERLGDLRDEREVHPVAAEQPRLGPGVRAGSSMSRFLEAWAETPPVPGLARLLGVSGLNRVTARLYRAALAEFSVAEVANRVAGDGHVVHGLNRSGAEHADDRPRDDVSHVIIGSRGVFALTTVNPCGSAVWVSANAYVQDGVRMAHLRDAEFNALRLAQRIFERSGRRVAVVPGIVVANPRRLIVDRRPTRVALLRPRDIAGWIEEHPRTLSPEEVEQIARTASAVASARSSEPESFDELLSRFREVHHGIDRAARRRISWVAVALLAVWVGIVAVAGYL